MGQEQSKVSTIHPILKPQVYPQPTISKSAPPIPPKQIINSKINDYYNFNTATLVPKPTDLPKLYVSSKDDFKYNTKPKYIPTKVPDQDDGDDGDDDDGNDGDAQEEPGYPSEQIEQVIEKHIQLSDLAHLGFNIDEKNIMVSDSISIDAIDPYELLKANSKISLQKLYDCYKKLRNINHPDKCSGTGESFIIIVNAMKIIEEIEKKKTLDKPFNTLKNEFEKDKPHVGPVYAPELDDTKIPFNERFNKFFDANKYTVDDDIGYGDQMIKTDNGDRTINIENKLGSYNNHHFNSQFQREKNITNNEVIVYRVPEPILLNSNSQSLVSTQNNFTTSGIYTDYLEAFSQTTFINSDNVHVNINANLKEELDKRKKETLVLTTEQQIAIEKYDNSLKDIDYNELDYFRKKDKDISNYHNRIKEIQFKK